MAKKYSLNDVNNLISKFRKRKLSNLSDNTEKDNKVENLDKKNNNNEYIPKKENIITNISKEKEKNNIDMNFFRLKPQKEESKNNYDIENSYKNNKKNVLSVFGNIYNSFSNNFSNIKENVFDTNILDNYFKELDLNYEESNKRRNKIISQKIKKEEIDNKIDSMKNDINSIKIPKYRNYYNISKSYLIKYSDIENKINLTHCNSLLFKEIDYNLYNNYTPVSYDNNNIDIKKYQDLLGILIDENNIKEPIGCIASLLIQNILINDIDLNKINILENTNIKTRIINILFNSIKNKSSPKSSLFINNKKILEIINTQNYSFFNYNILSTNKNDTPLDFIIKLFENNILMKNHNILYYYFLLLNQTETNIKFYLEEIFNNFDIFLYIIFKYFDKNESKIKNICELLLNSFYPKMTLCQYIILKIILGNHDIINEKFYAKIFTSFLNFSSYEKLLISDCYNLILFTINPSVKNIFAKCSILIKYKYSLLKQQYKQDKNDLILREKIYENINQFGEISKNKYFCDYIKNEFCCNKGIIIENNNNENNNNIFIPEVKNNKNENDIEEEKNLNININSEENKIKNEENKYSTNNGFFSSIKFAFGFRNDNSN